MKDKLSWKKFFNSGDFHRKGSWGSNDEIKRVTEDLPEPLLKSDKSVTNELKKCPQRVPIRVLKPNRINNPKI